MSIDSHNVAIVGLGRVGTRFLEKVAEDSESCINVRCVAELLDTPGKDFAKEQGIPVVSLEGIIEMGTDLDVIFNFTGSDTVTDVLTANLEKSCNRHTKIAQERVARLIWSLIDPEDSLPEVKATKYQAYADMLFAKLDEDKKS